jgi:hypothetical protein
MSGSMDKIPTCVAAQYRASYQQRSSADINELVRLFTGRLGGNNNPPPAPPRRGEGSNPPPAPPRRGGGWNFFDERELDGFIPMVGKWIM